MNGGKSIGFNTTGQPKMIGSLILKIVDNIEVFPNVLP